MTSVYNADGKSVACSVIEAGPCVVTQVKTVDDDGYAAVQLAFGEKKEKNTSGAMMGHFKKAKTAPKRKLAEFDSFDTALELGALVNVDVFADGEYVNVVGTSKGKGFQGVVKRHGFSGVGGATHGQHNRLRAPGSMGASSDPSRVFKGKRLAGQTGDGRVTKTNMLVIKVIKEKNLILIKGAVPGHNGAFVLIEK